MVHERRRRLTDQVRTGWSFRLFWGGFALLFAYLVVLALSEEDPSVVSVAIRSGVLAFCVGMLIASFVKGSRSDPDT